jgi:hypothetical protein
MRYIKFNKVHLLFINTFYTVSLIFVFCILTFSLLQTVENSHFVEKKFMF